LICLHNSKIPSAEQEDKRKAQTEGAQIRRDLVQEDTPWSYRIQNNINYELFTTRLSAILIPLAVFSPFFPSLSLLSPFFYDLSRMEAPGIGLL